jgi:hypothetical protein
MGVIMCIGKDSPVAECISLNIQNLYFRPFLAICNQSVTSFMIIYILDSEDFLIRFIRKRKHGEVVFYKLQKAGREEGMIYEIKVL